MLLTYVRNEKDIIVKATPEITWLKYCHYIIVSLSHELVFIFTRVHYFEMDFKIAMFFVDLNTIFHIINTYSFRAIFSE